ncbi:MAG TPA: P44/Msp2 family outer membrane protein [Sphingomicrobium sp.]
MKKLCIASCATILAFISSQAQAATPYVSVHGGLARAKDNDVDIIADYSTAQSPSSPSVPAAGLDQEYDDVFSLNYGKGYDVAIAGGYDFGWFRTELELSHRKLGLRDVEADDFADSFLSSANQALNRPSQAPDPGAPGLPALATGDFDLDGEIRATSVMLNGMFDIKITKGLSAYLGYGAGRSWVNALGDRDSAWGWQRFYGARYKVSDKVELGFKLRRITSGVVKLQDKTVDIAGNPDRLSVAGAGGGPVTVDRTTNAMMVKEVEGEFRSRQYLVSLFYNF